MNETSLSGCLSAWRPSHVARLGLFPMFLGLVIAAGAAPIIPEHPLITTQSAIPLTMLVVGRDHTLFYEAYNDASDINEDGVLDLRFNPSITYYGLFDSTLCYTHSGGSANTGLFKPSSNSSSGKCPGKWSGNWLNYVTTSRVDALRKVFYGGYREIDLEDKTILRRAYIPQDGHSWAKEYSSSDGYLITDYTPLSQPTDGKRHFFGNVTMNGKTSCSTLDNCSQNLPPFLSVVTNSSKRVWDWASTEMLVLNDGSHGGTRTNYTVRVEVCTNTFNAGCTKYPSGFYKPTGLLHEYGENDLMLFGLLTGSYNKNMSGGVLRKVVSSFSSEVDPKTGVFASNGDAKIVDTLNRLRIRDFNNTNADGYYRTRSFRTGIMNEGAFVDWGNPVAEMMYETLRYFAGKGAGAETSAFLTSGSHDAAVGLSPATWDNPYSSTSAAKAEWCAKPNMLVMSSSNISYDSDQLPGSAFGTSVTGDLSGMNVSSLGDLITSHETDVTGPRFIGAVGSNEDYAPTVKNVVSLGNIRGLSPEEPTKQGSYYSASVAYYGKKEDLNAVQGDQSTDTFVVALASPFPKFEFNVAGKTISLVPFAKTIDGLGASRTIAYQPTDPIVDFYVEEYSTNKVRFRINYEADEQGNDFDMDVIVLYDIEVVGNTLVVTVKPIFESTGSNQNLGYVISGTDRDGAYLVAQDKLESLNYFLNVPPGRSAGYCNTAPSPFPAGCAQLPWIGATAPGNQSQQTFSPGTSTSASTLKSPLWYAAKWGGFIEQNKIEDKIPNLLTEWDSDKNSIPDTYFLVQNPLKLRDALKKSFDSIIERTASAGNITSNGQQAQSDSKVFQTQFNSALWDGELLAYSVKPTGVDKSEAVWKASMELPSYSSRNIFTWEEETPGGIPFEWDELTDDQKDAIGDEQLFDYLRGDKSNEISGTSGTYRARQKLIGDIIHSSPYYIKDTDTVFVGSNDGMLHAFSASTGSELFAYIPGLIFGKLDDLASTNYTHTFYVDGDIAVSSIAQTPSTNYLVASTGRGAKGLFALDVTTPGSFAASDALWEYSGNTDADLGFILGRPQIGTLENGSQVVVVGNGHNSANGKAVLYIFDLKTGGTPVKLDTLVDGDNGMSTPTLWDEDGNDKVDTIYAGDLKGNVWRFDVSADESSAWHSEYQTGTTPNPMFTAVDPTNNAQPITAQLTIARNTLTSDPNHGKKYIFFGTGSYVYANDPNEKQVQTWYGLIDEGEKISSRASLKKRSLNNAGAVSSYDVRVFSAAAANDMSGYHGWFIDLDYPSALGERIVTRSNVYQLLEPVLFASSIVPSADPCNSGGNGYINAINPYTGARLSYSPFDMNDDSKFDANDTLGGEIVGSFDPEIGMPGEATIVGDRLVVGGSTGDIADIRINLGAKQLGRLSWREIMKE